MISTVRDALTGAWPAIVVVTVTVIFSLPTFFRIAIATLVRFSFRIRVWFDGTCTLPLATTIVFGFFDVFGLALAVAARAGRGLIPAATEDFAVPVPPALQTGPPQATLIIGTYGASFQGMRLVNHFSCGLIVG